jgi:hypothetical protein
MHSEIEERMIEAHKAGVEAYKLIGDIADMQPIIRQAHRLYRYEHERDAYVAGFIGERRRQQERSS